MSRSKSPMRQNHDFSVAERRKLLAVGWGARAGGVALRATEHGSKYLSATQSSVVGVSATKTRALPGRSPPREPNREKEGLETAVLIHSLC